MLSSSLHVKLAEFEPSKSGRAMKCGGMVKQKMQSGKKVKYEMSR